jgi:hypothetical protein
MGAFKVEVRGAARTPVSFPDVLAVALAEYPEWRVSERVALAEQAVWELLYQGGFKSAEELAASDEDTVSEVEGVGPERGGRILAAAKAHVEQKRVEEAALAAAGEVTADALEVDADAVAAPVPVPVPEEGRE